MDTITRRDLLWSAAPLALSAQTGANPVAEALIKTKPESWGFDWGDGVQMYGLLTLARTARLPRYTDWVEKWARHHLPKGVEALLGNQAGSPRKGFCGPWVCFTAFLELADQGRGQEFVAAARETARYITKGAERSKEGLLGHYIDNHQLWVDTLAMACPLLCRLAVKDSHPAYFDDAVLQILLAEKHVDDPATGFLYHMWDWDTNTRTGTLWGRGNGWVILTLADTLELLPAAHPKRPEVIRFMRRHTKAWIAAADKDGLWHTILNDPSSYAESSATAFAVYGLLKLARLGHLDRSAAALARKSYDTLAARYVKNGEFTGVSDGTLPQDRAHYVSRKQGVYPWGTGAWFLASSEILRLRA